MLASLQKISGLQLANINTYQKIFQTQHIVRHFSEADPGLRGTSLANLKAPDSPIPQLSNVNHFSQPSFMYTKPVAGEKQKVLISKCGNTASIVEHNEFAKPSDKTASARKTP